MAKVYVSSTIADLKQERQAVMDWLRAARHQAVDSYLPGSETVRDSCLADLDTCDLYVLILGHRYGFQPPDNNPEGLSITQLEFRRAGQSRIPRIALLRTSIPDENLSDLADPERLALVRAFREEVGREVRPALFHDLRGLIQELSTGVEAEMAKLAQRPDGLLAGVHRGLGRVRGIFLSYRREDAGPYARLLQRELKDRFPDARVFMDLDSIEAGVDFEEVIRDAVGSSAVLVALIGHQWATLADEQGRRRLDEPDDFVRFELRTALESRVRVIPVLLDGAKALRREQLPAELQALVRLNAFELTYPRYEYDANRLLDLIRRVLAGAGELADAGRQALAQPAEQAKGEAERQAREEVGRKPQEDGVRPVEDASAGAPAQLSALEQRARSAALAGDKAGARDQYAALLPIRERVSGPEHPDTLDTRRKLARWTGKAGDVAGARDQYAALLHIWERILGPEHPYTVDVRHNLAYWTEEAQEEAGRRARERAKRKT